MYIWQKFIWIFCYTFFFLRGKLIVVLFVAGRTFVRSTIQANLDISPQHTCETPSYFSSSPAHPGIKRSSRPPSSLLLPAGRILPPSIVKDRSPTHAQKRRFLLQVPSQNLDGKSHTLPSHEKSGKRNPILLCKLTFSPVERRWFVVVTRGRNLLWIFSGSWFLHAVENIQRMFSQEFW